MEAARTEFATVIEKQYQEHCKTNEKTPSTEDFLQYLMQRSLITDLSIKRFVVVNAYPQAFDNLGLKQNAIWELENKFNVPESTVKVILARHQKDFRLKD